MVRAVAASEHQALYSIESIDISVWGFTTCR